MISERRYQDALAKVAAARKRVARVREEAESQVMQVVQTAEVSASAFGHSLIEGYWNGVEFLGVPLPLLTGTGMHVLGFMDVAPEHLHNFGDGAYAAYVTTLGLGIGEDMRRKGANGSAAAAQGLLPGSSVGAGLSDAELAALASAA